ncbi:hypothetical protein SGQ44_00815 [Flavobacterium sp. Fl-77]|uniref:Uncharacterized protein n=1 Tax=Flavobacterium flavipigmentatum TaxID=2893884 RepID=A0AAJ2VWM2_9FLAO|nr:MULTISPECIES: hypothetical protein [unclassified Flavobacterium]MDX6180675.1 hypothetical protein [Flavobacterium sp. Fl-33]MDX6184275.1 hypothetical protein [Flavobacterium sp. Fl-77]UFH39387.1 hypothetical protein LNP22_03715 [Flavobacterium sp. F-70]
MKKVKTIIEEVSYKDWGIELINISNVNLLKITPSNSEVEMSDSYKIIYIQDDIRFQDLIQICFNTIFNLEKYICSHKFLYKDVAIFCPNSNEDKFIKIENKIVDPYKSKMVSSFNDIIEIISDITYEDWEFDVFEENELPTLQIKFKEIDTISGEESYQYSRKWLFAYNEMGKTQVIQTCYLALSTAIKHESRENLKYKNKWIANPHRSINLILEENIA